MTFTKSLEKVFLLIILLALSYIAYSWYDSNQFKTRPLAKPIQERIQKRQAEMISLIGQKFALRPHIPLIVSDEFHSNLYGLTAYKEGKVIVYLNKKRFKESTEYMIKEVIPHEYAHAMVFILGQKSSQDGHTPSWQKICLELDGKDCERYVDNEEIIRQKML